VFNHFATCVTNLDRSARFYCDLFGFTETRRLTVPDGATSQLLSVDEPVGLTAAYLEKDGVTLELLWFDRPGNPASGPRPFNQPGLTHMSFSVGDIPATCTRVVELGGSVLEGTDIGVGVIVLDPDGQKIELLTMAYRDRL
jgi:lactoylglutathione lyase